ncbi:DUF6653 family protein, partial [Proteus mirabilis]|uniref:DUF6653 family protein n=1 Tax=Proteus mirabilis TaxID=584 RepID=UPI0034D63618
MLQSGLIEIRTGRATDATPRRHCQSLRHDRRSLAPSCEFMSVYTRFTAIPTMILAVWSRAWLGWWALIP